MHPQTTNHFNLPGAAAYHSGFNPRRCKILVSNWTWTVHYGRKVQYIQGPRPQLEETQMSTKTFGNVVKLQSIYDTSVFCDLVLFYYVIFANISIPYV